MWVVPDTAVYLIEGVPLDNSYTNTIWFDTPEAQNQYFLNRSNFQLEKYSYQRIQAGVIHVQLPADVLNAVNYMVFQNTAHAGKWYYCFVTDVSYLNEQTAAVHYELDVMQSYHFDYTMQECWVEREHSASDALGEHTLPEPVDFGTPKVDGFEKPLDMHEYTILISSTWGMNGGS